MAQAGSRREGAPDLTPFDRAALETLGAAVLLPIRRREELTGFGCLGPKSSGDVYTSTDVALLAAVGSKLSGELLRLDDRDILQDAWAMQERLRRYVPEPVANQLAGGRELVSAEREVSVLFVDIRGHTSYAEARGAEQVFSTVNRFTETVSGIVRQHGGTVLEFSGDGLMAVFGATDEPAQKEQAAVEAGREMVEAVGTLTPNGSDQALSVGVGIATGPAFLGDVRAVDRLIWTAIGNTPNLAARLQALTRELGAAIVIDPPTWREARSLQGTSSSTSRCRFEVVRTGSTSTCFRSALRLLVAMSPRKPARPCLTPDTPAGSRRAATRCRRFSVRAQASASTSRATPGSSETWRSRSSRPRD